jgi:signal transduction histidine kinase
VANENLSLLRSRPKVRAAAIYDARGRRFAAFSRSEEDAGFPELPEAGGARVEGNRLVVFKRIVREREILGTVYLKAEYELADRMLGYLGIAALTAAVAMLVAYFFSRWIDRVLVLPVVAIAAVATEVTRNRRFDLRAQTAGDDEIGLLADSGYDMLSEIERTTADLEASNRQFAREAAERSKAEEQVRELNLALEQRVRERTAQLEYSNGELEAFCYTVSHDLRAPLRSIDGFSQALVEDFAAALPAEAQRYVGRIRGSTQRMGQLIEDLLNLSKVSRSELQMNEVDVGALAKEVVGELRLRESGRQVEVFVWDDMQAQADRRLLRAALENLIANAWKFTAKADAARIEIGMLRDGAQASFFVKDNGAGFDMAFAGKLFGAFQRLHSTNEFQGTGIGLATVQRIVHRHGGRIWADARPGKGAVFFFTLAPGLARPADSAAKEVAA